MSNRPIGQQRQMTTECLRLPLPPRSSLSHCPLPAMPPQIDHKNCLGLMSERHPHPPNQKQAAATKDAGLHSTCHLTCFSPVSSTLGSIFLSRTSTIEWREAGLARGQIGCPYFIFSFTNILVWDFQHSLWPCAWAPPGM